MDYEKNAGAIANEIKERMRILGFTNCYTTYYAGFDAGEKIRAIPFYGNWLHMNKLYTFKCNDALERAVKSVEGTYGCRVYAAIYNHYEELGDMLTLLTISPDEIDWDQERKDLKRMLPIAYVHNFTYPESSEWGYVVLKVNGNVLVRIG